MCKNTFLMNRDAKQNVDVPKFNLEWKKNKISVYLSDLINFLNIFLFLIFKFTWLEKDHTNGWVKLRLVLK